MIIANMLRSDHRWGMEAELRKMYCDDVDDLRSYAPGPVFCVWLRTFIGTKASVGEDTFDFAVCSPAWLAAEVEQHRLVSGRFHLFMAEFDYSAVESYVGDRIKQASGGDWTEIALKLSRWAHWEFEDYVE